MPSKEDAPKKRARRTKAEIEQEFNQIAQEENEAIKYSTPKAKELAQLQEQEIINAVKGFSSEDIIRKFADLNIDITKILSSLSEQIISEIQFLNKLRQAVEIEKQEIERLHKIDIAQTAVDQLLEEYQVKREELETEILTQRNEWEEEKAAYEAESKDEAELLAKMRKREAEEYEYKKNLERKKAQDKYEEEMRLSEKLNKEKQETLQKSWQQREENIKNQEDELISLRKTVNEYPSMLKQEVEKAVCEAISRTEQKQAHEIELLKRDNESEKRIAELKIKTLEESLGRQLSLASNMQDQVEEAKKQVQDIAVKAIEGASGAKAFQIALEQTKARSPV